MRKAFVALIAMISSLFLGVAYLQPERKEFVEDYYKGNQTDEPDYKQMYNLYNGSTFESIQECNKSPKTYKAGYSPYQPDNKNNFYWFWTVNEKQEGIMTDYEQLPNGFYKWNVPEGTQLIAIGNGYLSSTSGSADNAYPEADWSRGVYLSYIIKNNDNTIAYRITYGSMLRWWCCMDKETPDADGPRYGHTVSFSEEDKFYSGSIVGEAGTTGVPQTIGTSSGAVVMVQIERCGLTLDGQLDGSWVTATLEELYEPRTNNSNSN